MSTSLDYDIVVNDDACQEAGLEYKEISNSFTNYLNTYSSILQRVLEQGILSGKVYNNLEKFFESVETLKDQLGDLADTANKSSSNFIEDMDKADSYLY